MNLAPFQDITFDDTEAFDDFKLSLQLNHDRIAQKLFAASLIYQTYPLIDSVAHTKDWQQNLQQELGSIFSRLQMTGLPDFASADLGDKDDFEDFLQLLIFTEIRVNHILGIF